MDSLLVQQFPYPLLSLVVTYKSKLSSNYTTFGFALTDEMSTDRISCISHEQDERRNDEEMSVPSRP